jgi:hypothetical protein
MSPFTGCVGIQRRVKNNFCFQDAEAKRVDDLTYREENNILSLLV